MCNTGQFVLQEAKSTILLCLVVNIKCHRYHACILLFDDIAIACVPSHSRWLHACMLYISVYLRFTEFFCGPLWDPPCNYFPPKNGIVFLLENPVVNASPSPYARYPESFFPPAGLHETKTRPRRNAAGRQKVAPRSEPSCRR